MTSLQFINDPLQTYKAYLEICNPLYINGNITPEELEKKQEDGFLMESPVSEDKFYRAVFYEAAYEGSTPIGIIRADKFYCPQEDRKNTVFYENSQELMNLFDQPDVLELGVIATRIKGVEVAKTLLDHLESYMHTSGYNHLFSWVPTMPHNKPSIRFHSKNGFSEAALYSSVEDFGFKNYSVLLFYKSIK